MEVFNKIFYKNLSVNSAETLISKMPHQSWFKIASKEKVNWIYLWDQRTEHEANEGWNWFSELEYEM